MTPKKLLKAFLLVFLCLFVVACSPISEPTGLSTEQTLDIDGSYTSADDVAAYLTEFGRLPDNFITKEEARELGWEAEKGNLHAVAPNKSIGGDRFSNREGLLPEKQGRRYYECDINYNGGHRGAERLVYSDDGLIFYTTDHYASFIEMEGTV